MDPGNAAGMSDSPLLTALRIFDLRVFQNPTGGGGFRRLGTAAEPVRTIGPPGTEPFPPQG